jgi:hypothetical protein
VESKQVGRKGAAREALTRSFREYMKRYVAERRGALAR